MRVFFAMMMFMSLNTFAKSGFGKVLSINGKNDSVIMRQDQKVNLTKDQHVELQDKVISNNGSISLEIASKNKVTIHTQSEVKFSGMSLIDFLKGGLTVTAGSELKVQGEGVAFVMKKGEFQLSETKDTIDLDVISGEVTVSSPYVQTFVPEVVKAKEGFSFGKTKKGFSRRKFSPKFK